MNYIWLVWVIIRVVEDMNIIIFIIKNIIILGWWVIIKCSYFLLIEIVGIVF